MAFLSETETWIEGIYQIEEEDPVMGGPNGIDNRPNRELACRTRYLKKQVEDLRNSGSVEEHNKDVNAHTTAFALHNADPKAHGSISGVPVGTILLFPVDELPKGSCLMTAHI